MHAVGTTRGCRRSVRPGVRRTSSVFAARRMPRSPQPVTLRGCTDQADLCEIGTQSFFPICPLFPCLFSLTFSFHLCAFTPESRCVISQRGPRGALGRRATDCGDLEPGGGHLGTSSCLAALHSEEGAPAAPAASLTAGTVSPHRLALLPLRPSVKREHVASLGLGL